MGEGGTVTSRQQDGDPQAAQGPFGMAEHKCVVGYCCCGCSLRSGSLAIGIVILILTLLNCIYNIYSAVKTGATSFWINFAINLIIVIVSCLLIQGIRTSRRSFVMAWVWTMAVLIVINIIMSIIILVTVSLVFGLISLVVLGVFIYLVVVVRSYGLSLSSSSGVA